MPISHRLLTAPAFGLVALAATSGCAPVAEPEMGAGTQSAGRQCFLPRQVSGFTPRGNEHVLVHVGPRRTFELEIVGTCVDINWSNRIGIRSRGVSWVCQGLDAELLVPGPTGVEQCPVTNVRQLSDEEAAAHRQSRRR